MGRRRTQRWSEADAGRLELGGGSGVIIGLDKKNPICPKFIQNSSSDLLNTTQPQKGAQLLSVTDSII
jgi:hypothetical protein